MVQAEFSHLERQPEPVPLNAVALRQPASGIAPERRDTVDVPGAFDELLVAMTGPKALPQTGIDQAVIASPASGVDDAIGIDFIPDAGLQRSL